MFFQLVDEKKIPVEKMARLASQLIPKDRWNTMSLLDQFQSESKAKVVMLMAPEDAACQKKAQSLVKQDIHRLLLQSRLDLEFVYDLWDSEKRRFQVAQLQQQYQEILFLAPMQFFDLDSQFETQVKFLPIRAVSGDMACKKFHSLWMQHVNQSCRLLKEVPCHINKVADKIKTTMDRMGKHLQSARSAFAVCKQLVELLGSD